MSDDYIDPEFAARISASRALKQVATRKKLLKLFDRKQLDAWAYGISSSLMNRPDLESWLCANWPSEEIEQRIRVMLDAAE
jgi:hypothetical protein